MVEQLPRNEQVVSPILTFGFFQLTLFRSVTIFQTMREMNLLENSQLPVNMTGKNPRGARVYGNPMCKELASFIEDVNPMALPTRTLSMFLAGDIQYLNVFGEMESDNP